MSARVDDSTRAALGIRSARSIGIAVSLLARPDALWRMAAYHLQPPLVCDAVVGPLIFAAAVGAERPHGVVGGRPHDTDAGLRRAVVSSAVCCNREDATRLCCDGWLNAPDEKDWNNRSPRGI